MRTHKRKHHHHHHSNKSERKKHKEHKSREEKSLSHKQKRKKHHKERLPDSPNQGHISDAEFKMPHTRSAVTVIKRPTDPKVSLLAPDLESPVLPPCVQNFADPEVSAMSVTCSDPETVNKDNVMTKGNSNKAMDATSSVTTSVAPTMKTGAATSSESLEEDGIEEGEILEGTGTHTPTGSIDQPVKDAKVVRKLKRKPSQSIELSMEKQSSHKLKKRKWKKEKDISGEKTKKHKLGRS